MLFFMIIIAFALITKMHSFTYLVQGQNGSHFEPKPVLPPLPNKCDWEIDPSELDFSTSSVIGKVCFWLTNY